MQVYMSEITTYISRWNCNTVLSTLMTNHRLRNKNNTTDTTSGAGADYAFCEHEFTPVFFYLSLCFFLTSVRLHYHLFWFVFLMCVFCFIFVLLLFYLLVFVCCVFVLFTYYYLFVFVMSFFFSLFLWSGGLFLLFVFISAN
jgi:hypothetical protein